jgi:biopolymer transport protein ExbD
MASIDTGGGDSGHKKGPGVKKAKKLSTRVDMTPMVDLGFLLITFFIFTTTLSTPTTMDLIMPEDKDETKVTEVKQSGSLTILLGKADQVYYYEGILTVNASANNFKATTFKGIRDVIINKKKQVMAAHVHDKSCEEIRQNDAEARNLPQIDPNSCLDRDLVVIIKPDENANYKNTVDILDEMAINGVTRYAIVEPFPDELKLIKLTEDSKGIK